MTVLTLQDMATQSGVAFGTSGARGKVADMTPDLCHAYATAFINAVVPKASSIVLGHDLRPSSPEIAAACAAAIESLGMSVIYGGALPTPALALYAAQNGSPAIVVTGSHIPFDRNGIKFYKEDGEISKTDERAMLDFLVGLPKQLKLPKLPAPDPRVEQAYLDRYIRFFGANALQGETIAVYEHSSVARDVLRTILETLGAEVISLGRTDVFVPIDTEAVRHEDIEQAREWAELYDFDAIVSTDGDADRPLIGDEKGEWMRGDVVGILTAQYLHATAVVTPVSSNSALERTQSFAQVVRTRIGSPYVIEGMQQAATKGAELVVGYEANGGFLLGSQVLRNGQRLGPLPTRDALLPMLALLCGAKAQALKMSEVGYRLPKRYTASDRIQNFATASSRELIASLRNDHVLLRNVMAPQAGPVEAIDETDGLRVHFASGDIVHLRPSGNAPELRCYAESTSVRSAKRLCDECLLRILKSAASA
ncbi:Phosphoglucosamine mutase [Curvibacter sp. AEP1-3]|uniref:phosphomannomutase n=1 Tax=Curvibacter sp. AEP1-3 TaxID=1844971 RepID=UPI000B3CE01F|nr:phosphomannomutase [Curvibacter sp. AEP1-3]ARV20383.1 Phosphoglucosamine mutase [Curvibacter sp. AEP1-3]